MHEVVVICSHFSIFGTLETTGPDYQTLGNRLWFALILVSLEHWKQPERLKERVNLVVICSHFSIFGTLETTKEIPFITRLMLWFALILVSLEHWKQLTIEAYLRRVVVICSHFSIFGTLETTACFPKNWARRLWFALILVSLEHWKQLEKQRGPSE